LRVCRVEVCSSQVCDPHTMKITDWLDVVASISQPAERAGGGLKMRATNQWPLLPSAHSGVISMTAGGMGV
jgi:hypothetical protein